MGYIIKLSKKSCENKCVEFLLYNLIQITRKKIHVYILWLEDGESYFSHNIQIFPISLMAKSKYITNQGIQKNRVKNDRNNFEFPTLLSSEQGNLEWENFK